MTKKLVVSIPLVGKRAQKAFTLIELLVAVLIIGILAAVALPQYNKAVIKARFAEAKSNLQTLGQALQACVLANGDTGCNISQLDIDLGRINAGFYVDTENFMYDAGTPSLSYLIISAAYKKDNVCLCYLPITHSWAIGTNVCAFEYESGATPHYNYAELLGIPNDPTACTCC